MGETLVIGDVHLKATRMLPRVDLLLEARPSIERVVFLGDYMDDWTARYGDFERECHALLDWRRRASVQVDMLIGNHDLQYVAGSSGPGTHEGARPIVCGTLRALGLSCAANVGGLLATHGGLGRSWAQKHLACVQRDAWDVDVIVGELNGLLADGAYGVLDTVGVGRGGWELPSPLWLDLQELELDAAPCIGQVVGHTPVHSVLGFRTVAGTVVYACDTFSTERSGEPIGDGAVLVYREGVGFRSFELPEVG